jgi:hypothetical protein
MYRSLDPAGVVETIEALVKRIDERFPSAGLGEVCRELHAIARESRSKSDWIARPNHWLRLAAAAVVLLGVAGLFGSLSLMDIKLKTLTIGEFVQVSEAAMNNFILVGAALFFVVTIERRVKRIRALQALHELRCVAHVIDMHQLTKDPNMLTDGVVLTPSSPKRSMTAFEVMRYLNYCNEMLSLAGKLAALYAQNTRDAAVASAVNDLETLTTGLSRKIWQKMIILRAGAAP